MAIEAWVTLPDSTYLCHLERSTASPFRRFAIQDELNAPGLGSLEYTIDNAIVGAQDDLFAYGNLVWFRYRGKTRTWIVEERTTVLDEGEHQSDWIRVAGRGALQLIGDRTIWPTRYDDAHTDASQWELGGWSTTTNASAASGQRVIPVVSTTTGAGATVGDPVEIVGGANRQIGIIESIVADVSVTVVDNLAYTFPVGSRVRSAARQWRRFVNRAAGEMLWDIIDESNPRKPWAQITRGTIESTGADGWTQDFRFDNALDVLTAVTKIYGDVDMDGLTFNYYNARGVDRTSSVVLEEGADIIRLNVADSDRDSLSWVVAEGTGHAVFSYLAPKEKLTRAQRKTAARARKLHRKAPAAPRKVVQVKADYLLDLASEAVTINRPREAFLDAKDVGDPGQLDALADAALEEHQVSEAVGLEVAETRYALDVDYALGDWVRAIVPSRGFDEDVRVVMVTIAEDDSERIRVGIDVNTAREDHLRKLADGAKASASSLGVQNRQPQGNPTFTSISDSVYFDTTTASVTGIYISDRIFRTIECRLAIDFDQYPMPVSAAASSGSLTSDSGGGATSGSSSASSAANGGGHAHTWGQYVSDSPGAYTKRLYRDGPGINFNLEVASQSVLLSYDAADHTHGIPHTHSTPNHQHTVPGHTHSLTAAATKEAYPASHSVTLTVFELVDTTWTLRATISGLTEDAPDLDLTSYIVGPGRWRIVLQSAAAQPNGGRLGAHLSGFLCGAIQAA
jgi:hypothetical protein